jgi:hypothetical protein
MSKEAYSHYLLEVKQEYTKQLSNLLVPVIYEGLISIYNEAKRTNNESSMKVFQILLSRIPNWNQNIVEGEYQRILQKTQCDWLNDLITAVFISHAKILSSIKTTKKNKTLNLKVPNGEYFIHKAYIECARQFWKNPYLFYDDVQTVNTIDFQRNMREIEMIIEQSIQESVRKLLPVKDILQQYIKLDEDSSSSDSSKDDNSAEEKEKKPKKNKEEEKAKYHEEYITSNIPSRDRIKLEKSVRRELSKTVRENPDNNFSNVSVSNQYKTKKLPVSEVGGELPPSPEKKEEEVEILNDLTPPPPLELDGGGIPPPAVADEPSFKEESIDLYAAEPVIQTHMPILEHEKSASELLMLNNPPHISDSANESSIPDFQIDDDVKDFFSKSNEKNTTNIEAVNPFNDNLSMNTLLEQQRIPKQEELKSFKINIEDIPVFNQEPIPPPPQEQPEIKTVFINDNNKREEFEEVKDNKPTVSKTNLGQKRDIKKNYSFF